LVSKKRLAREKASADRWRKINGTPVNLGKSNRRISREILERKQTEMWDRMRRHDSTWNKNDKSKASAMFFAGFFGAGTPKV
jgi:hypothetical protein|tara:strand:+ start:3667 stop:3912 length:246 start_codon:yes stop_codon:yes gene_type:complete